MLQTEQLVKQALASTLNYSSIENIENHNLLREDLNLDSMGSLMFLMKLEETINGFYVDPETLNPEDLKSVLSVIHYVESQVLNREENVH